MSGDEEIPSMAVTRGCNSISIPETLSDRYEVTEVPEENIFYPTSRIGICWKCRRLAYVGMHCGNGRCLMRRMCALCFCENSTMLESVLRVCNWCIDNGYKLSESKTETRLEPKEENTAELELVD